MKKYYPSKAALNFLRLVIAAAAIGLTYVCFRYLHSIEILMYILVGIFWGGGFALCFIFLPLYFAKTSYSISSDIISKHSGMIFTTRQLMRGGSVQYVTAVITPFSRFTALNFIVINALGGKIFLAFLSKKDAAEITAALNKKKKKKEW